MPTLSKTLTATPAGARKPFAKGRAGSAPRFCADQFEFDFTWADNRAVLCVENLTELLNVSDQQVRNMIDEGRLMAFAINHDEAPQREFLRIVRKSMTTDLTCIVFTEWLTLLRTVDTWLFRHSRAIVTARDVATALQCSLPHVRALYDAKQIRAALVSKLSADRQHLRFNRTSVVDFVARRIEKKCAFNIQPPPVACGPVAPSGGPRDTV